MSIINFKNFLIALFYTQWKISFKIINYCWLPLRPKRIFLLYIIFLHTWMITIIIVKIISQYFWGEVFSGFQIVRGGFCRKKLIRWVFHPPKILGLKFCICFICYMKTIWITWLTQYYNNLFNCKKMIRSSRYIERTKNIHFAGGGHVKIVFGV